MLAIAKLATAALNAFLLIGKALFGWAIYRAGQQNQASKDQAETLKTVIAERDAVDTADSAEDAAREGRF